MNDIKLVRLEDAVRNDVFSSMFLSFLNEVENYSSHCFERSREESLEKILNSSVEKYLICKDNEAVGFCTLQWVESLGMYYICQFYIIPKARRLKIGHEAANLLLAKVGKKVFILLSEKNEKAKEFWKTVFESWKRVSCSELDAIEPNSCDEYLVFEKN